MNRVCMAIVVIVAIMIGVSPVFAQQESGKDRTVSPPQQDSIPQIDAPAYPTPPVGIPPVLSAVQYRRCPLDGQRLKKAKLAVFEGKVYRLCCEYCLEKFWENPQSVALRMKDNREVPLKINNDDGKCFCEKPASREFCRLNRETITFFCSSACREKDTKGHRTPVSRQKNPDVITGR